MCLGHAARLLSDVDSSEIARKRFSSRSFIFCHIRAVFNLQMSVGKLVGERIALGHDRYDRIRDPRRHCWCLLECEINAERTFAIRHVYTCVLKIKPSRRTFSARI